MVVRFEVALDSRNGPTHLYPVFTIPRISKGGEPLVCMSLQDGGTRADDFSSLASGVARSTQRTEATLGRRKIWCLRQGTLAGGLACPINIEDQPVALGAIPQPGLLLLWHQRASEQVRKRQGAQGFDRLWGQSR